MKINKIFFKISLAMVVAALSGCTIYPFCWFDCSNKDWYELIQLEQENECSYQGSQKAIDTCHEKLDKRSYEDYEIERKRTADKQRTDAKQ